MIYLNMQILPANIDSREVFLFCIKTAKIINILETHAH